MGCTNFNKRKRQGAFKNSLTLYITGARDENRTRTETSSEGF